MTALTHRRLIEISRSTILNAQRVVSDSSFAAAETRRIYSQNRAGLWKKHQKFARETLRAAARAGLTVEKPYKIVRDAEYAAVVGMLGSIACPMWHVKL